MRPLLRIGAALLIMTTSSANMDKSSIGSKESVEFIKAMDAAVRNENSQKELTKRMLSRATVRQPATRNLGNDDGLELDLTQYALKYVGCSAVNTWSDDVAEDADSGTVFALDQFVIFRLCPADYCGTYAQFGCQDSYGEYVISMEDYLQIMGDYHFDKFLQYCQTCSDCMAYGDDDDYGDDDNAANDDDAFVPQCQYYEACKNYQFACQYYESLQYADHEDYFECSQFKNNDDIAYLGPHCNSDGVTITIGMYSDEYCSNYVGNNSDVEAFTGLDLNDGFSDFFSSPSCISCLGKNEYDLFGDDDQVQGGDDVYDLCYYLYTSAAKCNVHLADANTIDSSQQAENEEMVCEFIKSLVLKTYDEYGEIVLGSDSSETSNWKNALEYQKLKEEVTVFQGVLLAFSILLFVILMVYSCYLHRKITGPTRQNTASRHRTVGRNKPSDTRSRRKGYDDSIWA